jgi:type IV pilus assembly protein PilN
MRISLNLATRPFADLGPAMKRMRIAMGALAFVALLLGIGLHAIHRKAEAARARDHSLDGQIAKINQERQGYENLMKQPPNAQLLKQAAVLNKLFDEKAFSWTLAMEDLETVLPGGVQVSTLAPERGKDGRITVRLKVIGPRNKAVNLVRNLEHSRRFLAPRIVSENAEASEKQGERLEPVSEADRVDFDLLAEYNPASAEERSIGHGAAQKKGKKSAGTEEDAPLTATHRKIPTLRAAPTRAPYTGPPGLGPGANRQAPPGGSR